jgi:PAS domain S-box-containing protein
VAAGVLAAAGAVLASDLPPQVRLTASDVGLLGGGVVATVCSWWRSRRSAGRRRRAWSILAAAGIVAAAANLGALVTSAPTGSSPAPSLSDVGFVIAMLLSIAGVLAFPSARPRGTELGRMVLDGVVVGGALLLVANATVFPQLLEATPAAGSSRTVALLLPVLDVVLATLAVLLFVRAAAADRRALGLVGTGFVLYALSDLTYAVLTAQERFSFGTPVDLGWIAGYLLIALAALSPRPAGADEEHVSVASSHVAGTLLLFGLVLLAALVSVAQLPTGLTALPTLIWLMMLLAVAARQTLLIADNAALRRDLERKVAERTAELHRLARQNELFLTSVGDGIYGVDSRGCITFINPAGAHTLGWHPDDLLGKPAHETFHAPRPDGHQFPAEQCYITEAITTASTTSAEADVYVRAGGQDVPVEVTATPLVSDEQVQGAVVVFRDVTQRREVDRLKSEFVSVVSHELRTPLTSIRGSLGLLAGGAMGQLGPPAARMVTIALESSERLTRLINDILDMERIDSGAIPMTVAEHDVHDLVGTAVAQTRGMAMQAGVALRIVRGEGRVRADADRVVQTLTNLLGNAIKFSPPDTVIEISAAPEGEHVLFGVTDRGRGIPEDKLKAIFNRFEQVDSSDARERGGTGLGLAISQSIVERHGGTIWAESHPGGGSTFRFTLPGVPRLPTVDAARTGPAVLVRGDAPTADVRVGG